MKFPLVAFVLPSLASAFVLPTPHSHLPRAVPEAECRVAGSFSHGPLKASAVDSALSSTISSALNSTLAVSNLMYTFGQLRDIVKDHEETFNEGLSDKQKKKKKKKTVAFDTPALVDTRNSAANPFPSAKMNNPVTAVAIKEFLDRNQKYLQQGEYEDIEFVADGTNEDPIWMTKFLTSLGSLFDADIIEFDDKFSRGDIKDIELVYSVVVNRSSKQIVVVFRGTVAANVKDALVDAQFAQRSPPEIEEISTRNAKVHKGFSGYLLGESRNEGNNQLEQIKSVLKELYAYKESGRDYSDYDLVVTGHSLGGSLAQLLSYILAGSKEFDFVPKPVTAMTWASPVVGNKDFFLDYQDLERADKVRHLRVSNRGDVVPATPGLGVTKPYWQTGVNVHLKNNKKAQVKYENTKSIVSQINPSSLNRHALYGNEGSYFDRLFAKEKGTGNYINDHVLSKTLEELYNEHAKLQD